METGTIRRAVLLPAPPAAGYRPRAGSKGDSASIGSRAQIPKRAAGRMTAYGGYTSNEVLGLWPWMGVLQT